MDQYDKRNKPPNTDDVDGVTNESADKCIKPDFCTRERKIKVQDVQSRLIHRLLLDLNFSSS